MTSIKVCMKCMGRNVKRRFKHKEADVDYFPLVMDWECEDCGYKGIPVVFCNEEDYVNFAAVREENDGNPKL